MADRMRRMRATVKDHNVYRWAANLIGALCDVRLESRDRLTSSGSHRKA